MNIAPPSSLSYSGSPYTFTQNVAISARTPTFSGSVNSCTSSPALPSGLGINGTTYVISGTPTVVQSAMNYTITATNSGGSTTATIIIAVNIASPSSLSYSGSPYSFTLNIAISARTPTFSGSVTSCTSSPTLPTGLGINGTTCVISGTPIVLQSATNYTITATNSSGSTTATISIAVLIAPPSSLSYSGSPFTFTRNISIASQTPTFSGSVTSCTSSPALPNGLGINGTTCVISGTPSVVQSAANYTITATNSSGSTTATISITVNIAFSISMPSGILKTGQITSYATGNDGYYQKGLSRTFITGGTTGLLWQRCSAYRSNDITCSGNSYYTNWSNANLYCNNLNTDGRAWRLPNIFELSQLVDYGRGLYYTIDTSIFIDIFASFDGVQHASNYWSSSPYSVLPNLDYAWNVYFYYYGQAASDSKTKQNYFKCISGQPITPSLKNNGDGTILDNNSGLIWQKCSNGQSNDTMCNGTVSRLDWLSAISYCENLTLGGRDNWRLPNINELKSIVDYSSSKSPSINQTIFPNTNSHYYWSSTTTSWKNDNAWNIYFGDGSDSFIGKSIQNYSVRCVTGP